MQHLREIARDDPEAVPVLAALAADMPDADPAFDWIWRAWHRLSDDRPRYGGGMGPVVPGRIPWMTVHTWAAHHHLSAGEMTLLDTCFGAMDTVYIDWWVAQLPKETS